MIPDNLYSEEYIRDIRRKRRFKQGAAVASIALTALLLGKCIGDYNCQKNSSPSQPVVAAPAPVAPAPKQEKKKPAQKLKGVGVAAKAVLPLEKICRDCEPPKITVTEIRYDTCGARTSLVHQNLTYQQVQLLFEQYAGPIDGIARATIDGEIYGLNPREKDKPNADATYVSSPCQTKGVYKIDVDVKSGGPSANLSLEEALKKMGEQGVHNLILAVGPGDKGKRLVYGIASPAHAEKGYLIRPEDVTVVCSGNEQYLFIGKCPTPVIYQATEPPFISQGGVLGPYGGRGGNNPGPGPSSGGNNPGRTGGASAARAGGQARGR